MARVTSFDLAGLDCVFYLLDHEPPPCHATRLGHWEVRVFFLDPPAEMLDVKWERKTLTGRDRKMLCDAATANAKKLLAQWEKTRS